MRNILQNKTANQTEHKSTTKYTCTRKKRKRLFEKGLKKIAKMQNLSQNELNQTAEMHNQPRDELERIAKIRRIQNYEEMSKKELTISLLKSKQSIAKLFNNNPDDDKIILNR